MPAGSGTLRLLFTIDADDKGAQAALQALEKQLGQTGKSVGGLGTDVEGLSKKLLGMSGVGGEATSVITNLGEAIGGMAGAITVGAVAALAALAAGLAKCVQVAISLGSELHDLSQITGISVENLSALRVAAITSGSSLEELSQAFVKFERAASDGGEKATKALEDFGLTAADVTRDPEAAFDQFLKKFNEIGPSATRTADTMALFGRGGARLIPTFLELGDGLEGARKKAEELGVAFSPELANRADEVGDKLDIFKLQLQAIFAKIGDDLLPVISKLADELIGLAKVFGPVATEAGATAAQFIHINGVMPELLTGFSALRSILKVLRNEAAQKGLIPEIKMPDLPEVKQSRFAESVQKLGRSMRLLANTTQLGESLRQIADKVPDRPPGVDESALLEGAAKGGLFAIKEIEKALADQREKAKKNEILAGLGLLKGPKEKKEKKAKDPTFEEETQDAKDAFNAKRRIAEQEQAALKADLKDKIINQDQFADFMKASEAEIALAHVTQVKAQAEIDLKAAKTPDERAAIHKKAADDIANIESALNVKLIGIEGDRVDANADAAKKIQAEDDKLKKSKEKLGEDIHDFWFKQAIAINEAIEKVDTEKIKPPQFVTQAVGVIADIHSTVVALDDQTRAWRETQFAAKDYFDAVQKGTASIADAQAQLDRMIQKLVDQSFQLALAGKAWAGIGLFITKALPLAFLSAFNQQLHKMIDAYIQTGHTGPAAMKQLLAGTLEALGQMASSWAAFAFSMALVAAAMGMWHEAALYLAGGIGLEALALALGFAASKVRPDAGGGGGTSSAGAVLQPPNTTINLGPGVTGAQLGGTPGDLFGAVIQSNDKHTEAIDRLWGTIAMSSPGDVVTRAATTAPNAFATGVQNASKSNATFNRNLGLNLLPST